MKGLAMLACIVALGANAADADWERFKQSFVEADGRVVDTGQARISQCRRLSREATCASSWSNTATRSASSRPESTCSATCMLA